MLDSAVGQQMAGEASGQYEAGGMRLRRVGWILLGGMVFLHIYLLLMTAWVCDDAFITFRTVDNVVHGQGAVWNAGERVQTYTHPLWFLLLVASSFFSGEVFFTALGWNLLLSLAVILIFLRRGAGHWVSALWACTILTFSKAYMDYTSSGLENALSHVLLLGICLAHVTCPETRARAPLFFVLCGLLCLTRMDFLLLVLPMIVAELRRTPARRAGLWLGLGCLPLGLWMVFSVIYYGFPFPNTAYAKMLSPGHTRLALVQQGGFYVWNSLRLDPITVFVIGLGIGLPWWRGVGSRPLSLGMLLYGMYIIWIGGDFMSGRFFSVLLLAAVFQLARWVPREMGWGLVLLWLGMLGLGSLPAVSPVKTSRLYGQGIEAPHDCHFIYDERAHYYPKTGLLAPRRWDFRIFRYSSRPVPRLSVEERIGMKGYLAGPRVYLLDYLALGDAFLARLPAIRLPDEPGFRIGHFYRVIPEGYVETVLSGINRLEDPALAALYDTMHTIIRGPLWSRERWRCIFKMNFGYELSDRKRWQHPAVVVKPYAEVPHAADEKQLWFDPASIAFWYEGIQIVWDEPCHAREIELSLDQYGDYRLEITLEEDAVAEMIELPKPKEESIVLRTYRLPVSEETATKGFCRLKIRPKAFTNRHALGHVFCYEEKNPPPN